jgi:LytR cell envelope-related transcriptional attenuator
VIALRRLPFPTNLVVVPDPHSSSDLLGGGTSPQVAKGAALLVVAVLIGAFLLWQGFDNGSSTAGAADQTNLTPTDEPSASEPTVATTPESTTTSALPRPPAEVKVLVANGTDVKGTATQFSQKLATEGYVTSDPGTGDNSDYTTSVVYYSPDYEAEAAAVASAVGIDSANVKPMPDPVPTKDGSLREASVLVIIGSDLAG